MAKVLVLGGGESGRGVALLAQAKGYEVFVSDAGRLSASAKTELDAAGIAYEDGGHSDGVLDGVDLIVKSPGIPCKAPLVASAKTSGIRVIGEMEFCAPYKQGRIVGITGSNGKTTTTKLVGHLLEAAGIDVVVGGNIGTSYARLLLEPPREVYVLELSSFQLEDIVEFYVDIGMVLNLSPDHLDRYDGSFAKYAAAKYRLKDTMRPADGRRGAKGIWLQASDPVSQEHATAWMGDFSMVNMPAEFEAGKAFSPWGDVSLTSTELHGAHNAANATFALFAAEGAIAKTRGAEAVRAARPVLAKALTTFVNAPHRLETVGYVDGVRYVNDSKATNLDAVVKAVGSFGDAPLVLILGGTDKGNDYAILDEALEGVPLRAIVAMGEDNKKIVVHYRDRGIKLHDTHSLADALAKCAMEAEAGDVVLLSPACASFDLFDNYIDRGNRFRAAVKAMPGFSETLPKPT